MKRSGPTIRRGESSGEHGTPWEFIHPVEVKFGLIGWDLAASLLNSKAHFAGLYLDEARNSLTVPWHKLERPIPSQANILWLNPPFANIAPWAGKCVDESRLGAEILLLVPGSIGANWYWDWVHPYADVYSVGRMRFVGSKDVYPKDLILCHYHPLLHQNGPSQILYRWRWQHDAAIPLATAAKS